MLGTPSWDSYAVLAIGARDWVLRIRGRVTDLRYPLSRVPAVWAAIPLSRDVVVRSFSEVNEPTLVGNCARLSFGVKPVHQEYHGMIIQISPFRSELNFHHHSLSGASHRMSLSLHL